MNTRYARDTKDISAWQKRCTWSTRKLLKQAIKDGRVKLSNAEVKRVEKLVTKIPLWWSRISHEDSYDHFLDGVLEGFILCLANVGPLRHDGMPVRKLPVKKRKKT